MVDYISRYGLEYNPFIKNSKEYLVETNEYNEVMFRLNYLLNNKGFGVLTGSPGNGKTTIIRNWAKSLNPSLYKVVYVALSTLTTHEFYKNLAVEMELEPASNKSTNFKNIQSEINRYYLDKRITPVIIIDEANCINNAVLNDMKILFNFDMDSKDRAIVLLVGQTGLINILNLSVNEPIRQRVIMNYNLDSRTKEEALHYIKSKIQGAKATTDIFDANALEAIVNAANGTPRVINKICNNCLIIANSKEKNIVDSDIAMMAVNESTL